MATTIGGIATSATTPLSGTELLEGEQGGVSVKLTAADIAALASVTVKQGGVAKGSGKTLNFTGNVTVTDEGGGQIKVEITAPAPGIPGVTTLLNGVAIDPAADTINFTGGGVTVTQVSPGVVQVAITGGGGGGSPLAVADEGNTVDAATLLLNFVGNVLAAQTAPGEVQVTVPAPTYHYDLGFFIGGLPAANSVVFRHKFVRAVQFAANFAGSDGEATTNSTGTAVFTVRKVSGGVTTTVGTITWSAANPVPVFASTGGTAVDFALDDTVELLSPLTQDATLAGCTLTLAGTRTA